VSGEISKWLMRDDQKEVFEVVVAATLNILFLVLIALLLWPLKKTMFAFRMAQGYATLWLIIIVTAALVNRTQRFFRVNLYDHANAFVISNLVVSCTLQVGWSVFAALTVHVLITGAPTWAMVTMFLVGGLSCLIAFFAVSSFYQGQVYKLISLPLALVGYISFFIGRIMYVQ